jgi:replicative DNA helicase
MPYSQEAEQSVLGAILLDSSYLNLVLEILPNTEAFYEPNNKLIYETMLEMFSSGKRIDYITVLDNIAIDSGPKEEMKNYMLDIVQIVPSMSNVESYAKIIRDKYGLRSLISLARDIIQESTVNGDSEKLLEFTEERLNDIRMGKSSEAIVSLKDVLVEEFEKLEKLNSENCDGILGLPTGYNDLDFAITGLNKSDLILLAARPGMGKTSFALNIAKYVSEKSKTVIFNLEMSKEQLAARLLSMEGKIAGNKIRRGKLNDDEWSRLKKASDGYSKSNLYIDDTACITVNEMKARVRRLGDVSLVIIDYLQLISSSRRVSNRVQEISEITRELKIMAKELNIPIICLSQLSRASEQRLDHRPMLSDLRDSGSIEQDADIVMMLYRERYYKPLDDRIDPNECECIIAKNRHGETKTIIFNWEPEYTKFTSMAS